MPNTRYPVMGHTGRPSQPPARRFIDEDEIVTGLELFAAQAEVALEAAHQDVAAAEGAMLEAMALAPETSAHHRTLIQLGLRDLIEKHACTRNRRP